jgi:WD40 repeat protein
VTVGAPQTLATVDARTGVTAADYSRHGQASFGSAAGKLWVVGEGAPCELLDAGSSVHDGPVTAISFSANGKRLFSVGGKVAAAWDLEERRLIRELAGPQRLTAGVMHPDGKSAYFGTAQGHVMRWRLGARGADAVREFACRGSLVYPARMRLPKKRRCPYGTYLETDEGKAVCTYPVTHLLIGGNKLLRSCRQGNLAILDLNTLKIEWHLAGHLTALAPAGADTLLLGRADGKVGLYRTSDREIVQPLQPEVRPIAAAASGALVAVAAGAEVRVYHRKHPRNLAKVEVSAPPVWVAIREQGTRLVVATKNGRMRSWPLRTSAAPQR